MSENDTTEGKSVPEAMRMIADWIEAGRQIEISTVVGKEWTRSSEAPDEDGDVRLYLGNSTYRAKPEKPRVISEREDMCDAYTAGYRRAIEAADRIVCERFNMVSTKEFMINPMNTLSDEIRKLLEDT